MLEQYIKLTKPMTAGELADLLRECMARPPATWRPTVAVPRCVYDIERIKTLLADCRRGRHASVTDDVPLPLGCEPVKVVRVMTHASAQMSIPVARRAPIKRQVLPLAVVLEQLEAVQ